MGQDMKNEYHQGTCEYCGKEASIFTTFWSGEPVSMCSSDACKEKHQTLIESEGDDFRDAGLI